MECRPQQPNVLCINVDISGSINDLSGEQLLRIMQKESPLSRTNQILGFVYCSVYLNALITTARRVLLNPNSKIIASASHVSLRSTRTFIWVHTRARRTFILFGRHSNLSTRYTLPYYPRCIDGPGFL